MASKKTIVTNKSLQIIQDNINKLEKSIIILQNTINNIEEEDVKGYMESLLNETKRKKELSDNVLSDIKKNYLK